MIEIEMVCSEKSATIVSVTYSVRRNCVSMK